MEGMAKEMLRNAKELLRNYYKESYGIANDLLCNNYGTAKEMLKKCRGASKEL